MITKNIGSSEHHDAIVERMEALLEAKSDEAVAELIQLSILAERNETQALALPS